MTPEIQKKMKRFGRHLRGIRERRGLSQEGAQKVSKGQIQAASIWQLEVGRIQSPTPHHLRTLSEIYQVSYLLLMVRAGHLRREEIRGSLKN